MATAIIDSIIKKPKEGSEIGLRYNEGGTRVQPKQQQVMGNLTLETKFVQYSPLTVTPSGHGESVTVTRLSL